MCARARASLCTCTAYSVNSARRRPARASRYTRQQLACVQVLTLVFRSILLPTGRDRWSSAMSPYTNYSKPEAEYQRAFWGWTETPMSYATFKEHGNIGFIMLPAGSCSQTGRALIIRTITALGSGPRPRAQLFSWAKAVQLRCGL